jgi:poly(A) polymerase
VSFSPSPEPREDHALEALEQAARCAEGLPLAAPRQALPEDFAAALAKARPAVRSCLDRVLLGAEPEAGLDALLANGALKALLPEVAALVGFGDGEWRHKDVWKHTKQVVLQADPCIELRWAALLHDIGKIKTRSISPEGEVHFFGHAELGARMFDKIERRIALFRGEQALQQAVRFLILHHLRANQYECSWTDSAVRRFAREMGPQLDNLLRLAQADITTKRPEKKKRGLRQIEELQLRITELAALDAIVPPLPGGIGNLIMEAFSLPPSKLIGEVKRALEQAIDEGQVPSHQPGEFYLELLRSQPERFGLPKS